MSKTGRKKKELPENAIVQKSRPLFDLWKYNFKLFDFKVFDLYLSAINSRNIDTKIVTFSKAEFSKILTIDQKLSTDELDSRLSYLRQKEISLNTDSKYPIHTSLFSACYVDTTAEPYNVKLEVSETLLSLVFDIDRINGKGYFSYKLRNILQIESLYSYLLFNYLESKALRRDGAVILTTWEVELQELKEILNCADVELYAVFKRFNDKVLKMCHKEITTKTEMQYDYETIKQGRYVKGIRFTVKPHKIIIETDADVSIPQEQPQPTPPQQNHIDYIPPPTPQERQDSQQQEIQRHDNDDTITQKTELYSDAMDNTFTALQVQVIVASINPDNLSNNEFGRDIARYDYLSLMYKKLLVEEQSRVIQNRFKYFVAMIKNDKGGEV